MNPNSSLPSVSVVTPSYNQGAFIQDAIESVASQNYDNLEHIIMDAKSTDQTLDVLDSFSHLEHLKWCSEKDEGQSDGLNKGFRAAQGEWILWLNADDYLAPNAIHDLVAAAMSKANVNYVSGHTDFVDEHKNFMKTVYYLPYDHMLVSNLLYVPPSTGGLFKTSLLTENPLHHDYHYLMDIEWFLRVGSRIVPAHVNHSVVSFRISDDNKTSQSIRTGTLPPRQQEEWNMIFRQYIYKRMPDFPEPVLSRLFSVQKMMVSSIYYGKKLRYGFDYIKQQFPRAL